MEDLSGEQVSRQEELPGDPCEQDWRAYQFSRSQEWRIYLVSRSQGLRIYLIILVSGFSGRRIYQVSRSQRWRIYLVMREKVSILEDLPGGQV